MLVITRKKKQKIIIADNIEITILDFSRTTVRYGINAPKEIPIQKRPHAASATDTEDKPQNTSGSEGSSK